MLKKISAIYKSIVKINWKSQSTYTNIFWSISVITSIFFTIGFLHGRELFKWNDYILNTEIVGHYGDFIGGAIGTLVSIVLLYKTLNLQRKDSESNALVYKQQQLNDIFFHLLKQYDDNLKSFNVDGYGIGKLQGRAALRYKVDEMFNKFEVKDNDSVNRKQAVSLFLNFYSTSCDFSPIYFRTLFRSFNLFEISDVSLRQSSVQLMKILRAQLSDTELVLLRYNCMTKQGAKFAALVNKFNLLKHLPPMELMEYKRWSSQMTLEDRGYTNVLLVETKHNIQKVLETSSLIESYSNDPKKYNINVSSNKAKNELRVCLYLKQNAVLNDSDLIRGIYKLSEDDRLSLLQFFVKDCLVMSSFIRLNHYKNMEISPLVDKNGTLSVMVKSKNLSPLRMRDTSSWN